MGELAEDRVYADRRGKTDVYVGSGLGVTLVAVSDDRVGRFRLLRRGRVHDVATDAGDVLLATADGVSRSTDGGETFETTGFGPAVAVGVDERPIAAGPDGRVATLRDGEWHHLDEVEDVRAIDGEWVAAGDGVYRVSEDGLEHSGLSTARDVAAGETPLAASADGIHRLVDGSWTRERAGPVHAVATDGDRAHAAGPEGFYEYRGEWVEREPPADEPVVDIGYAGGIVAVTEDGAILVDPAATKDGADGWRRRSLGLEAVVGLAVAEP